MMGGRRRTGGFSLLELLVAMAIAGILLGLAVANFRRGQATAGSKGLATVVAEELRLARQRAMADQSPVAVAFPSAGGTLPHCQSLYNMQGEILPRPTGVVRFDTDYPGAYIFLGYWNVASANTLTQGALVANTDAYDWRGWNGFADPMIIFTPSGSAISNGLPLFDGEFHVLVSEGISFTNAGSPGGSPPVTGAFAGTTFFNPSEVCAPFTIVVSPLGAVRVESGVVGTTGGIQNMGLPPGTPAAAPAPVLGAVANNPPTVDQVLPLPVPLDNNLLTPAGTNVLVSDGDHVSVRVEAQDGDADDPLYCVWDTNPPGQGAFSAPSDNRMEWDPTAGAAGTGAWVSTWEWKPPPADPLDTTYQLNFQVFDRRNGTTGLVQAGGRQASKKTMNRVVFYQFDGPGNGDLVTCRLDGFGLRHLTSTSEDEFCPVASPDGTKLILLKRASRFSPMMAYYICNSDGSNMRPLTDLMNIAGASGRWMCWAPDSAKVVIQMADDSGGFLDWNLYFKDLNDPFTSPPQPLPCNAANFWEQSPAWSPNGNLIAYNSDKGAGIDQWCYDLTTATDSCLSTSPPLTAPIYPLNDYFCDWSPDSTKLALVASDFIGGPVAVYTILADGSANTAVRVTPFAAFGDYLEPRWSPDGTKLAYTNIMKRIAIKNSDGTGAEVVLSPGPADYHPMWSSDGTYIFYVRDQPGDEILYRVRADGSEPPRKIAAADDRILWALGPALVTER